MSRREKLKTSVPPPTVSPGTNAPEISGARARYLHRKWRPSLNSRDYEMPSKADWGPGRHYAWPPTLPWQQMPLRLSIGGQFLVWPPRCPERGITSKEWLRGHRQRPPFSASFSLPPHDTSLMLSGANKEKRIQRWDNAGPASGPALNPCLVVSKRITSNPKQIQDSGFICFAKTCMYNNNIEAKVDKVTLDKIILSVASTRATRYNN